MKKFTLLSFILISCIELSGQVPNYHNSAFYHEKPISLIKSNNFLYYSVLISDSTDVFGFVSPVGTLTNEDTFCKIFKFDQSGLLIDSLILPVDSGFYSPFIVSGINNDIYTVESNGYDFNNVPFIKIRVIQQDLSIVNEKEYEVAMDFIEGLSLVFNGSILSCGINGRINMNETLTFFEFSESGDTIRTVTPDYISVFRYFSIPGENNYIIQRGPLDLSKIDGNYNIIWEQGTYCDFLPEGEIFWNEDKSEATIISLYNAPFQPGQYAKIGIVRCDSTFSNTLEAVDVYGGDDYPNRLGKNAIIRTEQHGYFIGSYKDVWSFETYFDDEPNHFNVRNYSEDLELVWSRTFGENGDSVYYVNDLVDVGDGIILSGWKYRYLDASPNVDVFLYKFDYLGHFNSIMERPGGTMQPQVYPNPGTDRFYVQTYGNINGLQFLLYDINGRLVKQEKLKSNRQEIDATGLPTGQYIWKTLNPTGQSQQGNWIKIKQD